MYRRSGLHYEILIYTQLKILQLGEEGSPIPGRRVNLGDSGWSGKGSQDGPLIWASVRRFMTAMVLKRTLKEEEFRKDDHEFSSSLSGGVCGILMKMSSRQPGVRIWNRGGQSGLETEIKLLPPSVGSWEPWKWMTWLRNWRSARGGSPGKAAFNVAAGGGCWWGNYLRREIKERSEE